MEWWDNIKFPASRSASLNFPLQFSMAIDADFRRLPVAPIQEDDESSSQKPVSPPARETSSWILTWSIETVASFFALSSFSVLVVVLKHYDGISPTAWPIGVLTLNGLVAVLSTITRAALLALVSTSLSQGKWIQYAKPRGRRLVEFDLYDQASRSVWGSLLYLCRTRGMHVATFGAVLTILTLAFNVFAQQVISFETSPALINVTTEKQLSTVPRAEVFTGSTEFADAQVINPGLPMEAAWYAGLFSFNATELQPTCPTGNCTWPVVSSLAVCGECADVSSDLSYSEDPTAMPFQEFNFSLPDGNQLVNRLVPTTVYRLNASLVNTSYPGLHYKSIEQDRDNGYMMLAHFEVISQRDRANHAATWGLEETAAHECALWFCIQAYDVSLTNGNLNQMTINQWSHVDPRSLTDDNSGGQTYFGSDFFNFTMPPAEFNVPEGTNWAVGARTVHDVKRYIDSFFPMWIMHLDGNGRTSMADAMWASTGRMDEYISDLARTMTQAVRIDSLTSPLGDVYYQGTARRDETLVRVRWAWLAFPAAMVVGSCLLLLVTVWRTERSTVGAWKASALALLFTRMGEGLQEAAKGGMSHETESLESKVGNERVRLSSLDGAWRLD